MVIDLRERLAPYDDTTTEAVEPEPAPAAALVAAARPFRSSARYRPRHLAR